MMATAQKFCLKWNNFQSNVTSVFDNLRQDEELVDITLCCEGQKIKAHRVMLSACSPYFRDLLKENPCQHPLFFLKDTSYADLAAVVEFVYKGEVNVVQNQLASFLKTAEMLQVKGLSGDEEDEPVGRPPAASAAVAAAAAAASSGPAAQSPLPPWPGRQPPPDTPTSPCAKRRRVSGGGGSGPPSPPPAPVSPPVVSQPPSRDSVDTVAVAAELGGELRQPPPPPPAPAPASVSGPAEDGSYHIKVEKIDVSADDDDESLEATLGQVAKLEGPGFDGSDHSASSQDMAGLLSRVSEPGGCGDTSLGAAAATSEDGSSQGVLARAAGWLCWRRPFTGAAPSASQAAPASTPAGGSEGGYGWRIRCEVCNRDFTQASYAHHMSMHRGRTTCPACKAVYATRFGLRRHIAQRHPELAKQNR